MPFDINTARDTDYQYHPISQQVTWTPQGGAPVTGIWAVEHESDKELVQLAQVGLGERHTSFWIWTNTITGGGTPDIGDKITEADATSWIIRAIGTLRDFQPKLRVLCLETR